MRRRLMMARMGGVKPASDGYIWAYYQVDDISSPTKINSQNDISEMIVDGVSEIPSTTYQFQSMGEHLIKYRFTMMRSSAGFRITPSLTEVYFPDNFDWDYLDYAFFEGNTNLRIIDLGRKIDKIHTNIDLPNLEEIHGLENIVEANHRIQPITISGPKLIYPNELNPNYNGFMFVAGSSTFTPLLEITKIPVGVTSLPNLCFRKCTNIPYLHFLNLTTPPTLGTNNPFLSTSFKLYVGDGSSAAADEAVKAIYLADTEWAKYSAKVDTWYNYLHPNN